MNMNFCCCLAIETVCLFGIMFLLSHSNKQWKYSCKFRAYMFSSWIFLAASSLLQSNSLHIEWKMPPTLFFSLLIVDTYAWKKVRYFYNKSGPVVWPPQNVLVCVCYILGDVLFRMKSKGPKKRVIK